MPIQNHTDDGATVDYEKKNLTSELSKHNRNKYLAGCIMATLMNMEPNEDNFSAALIEDTLLQS
jgi:hypothetical protein